MTKICAFVFCFIALFAAPQLAQAYNDPQQVIERTGDRQRETDEERNYGSRQQTEEIKTQIQESGHLNREVSSPNYAPSQAQQDLEFGHGDGPTSAH